MKILIVLILLSIPAAAFSDSLVFKLPALKISQIENGKNVVYEFEDTPNRFSLNDSFMTANPMKYNYKVNIKDINRITIKSGANVLPYMVLFFAIGGLFGAGAAGGFHGGSVDPGERVVGALVGGGFLSLVVGGIALLISHDNEYVLQGKSFSKKKEFLIDALKNNRVK